MSEHVPRTKAEKTTTARDFQENFYLLEENGAVVGTDDGVLDQLNRVNHRRDDSAVRGPNRAKQIRLADKQHRDDSWVVRQMSAAGFQDAEAQLGVSVAVTGGQTNRPAVELVIHRSVIPAFVTEGASDEDSVTGATSGSGVVLPLKDPSSDFAQNAAKGSAMLRDFRRRRMEQHAMREALGRVSSSTSPPEMSVEEYERLRRRLQTQQSEHGEVPITKGEVPVTTLDIANRQTDFTRQHSIAEQRRLLPIYACRDELLRFIRENNVIIVSGETGSGKTTQLAQYLYEGGWSKLGIIGCTQPRRMAAVGVAHRVAEEMGCTLGEAVGYAIQLEDVTSTATRIKFMTDGILLREAVTDRLLQRYSVIILDEAHERSINTDVLLGTMKVLLRTRMDFRLIVTSATMELDRFASFFDNAPIFTVPGRTFPIELIYEPSPVQDYVEMAVFRAVEIHTTAPLGEGDILIFMSGEDDVEGTCAIIKERLAELGDEWQMSLLVLPCYSMLPSAQQREIFAPAPLGKRKCIVSTNIAETSLTIDGIRYVIDSGYMKCKVFKPSLGMNALSLYPVSKAQADQRKGRAGRTSSGVCRRLYTEYQFLNELIAVPVPEIQRSSIDSVVLLLKSIGVDQVSLFDFIDPPPLRNVRSSLLHLWLIQALDDAGKITDEGRQLAAFPTEPPLARCIVQSANMGCSEEVLTVAAMMSVDAKSIFTLPKGREDESLSSREKFFVAESDHLTLLNVFEQFSSSGFSRGFADGHFLNYNALKKAADIRSQFVDMLTRRFKLKLVSCNGDTDVVRECFTLGFFPNAARRTGLMEYTTLLNGVPCLLHPASALTSSHLVADYVIYNDFVFTGKEYMSLVTAVDPMWLVSASHGVLGVSGDVLAAHKATLLREQRKAMSSATSQPRRPQPPAASTGTVNIATASIAELEKPAPEARPRFVPRSRR